MGERKLTPQAAGYLPFGDLINHKIPKFKYFLVFLFEHWNLELI
jgi:hypothetical protein